MTLFHRNTTLLRLTEQKYTAHSFKNVDLIIKAEKSNRTIFAMLGGGKFVRRLVYTMSDRKIKFFSCN